MGLISLQQLSVPVPSSPLSATEVQSDFWGTRDGMLIEEGSFSAELNAMLH